MTQDETRSDEETEILEASPFLSVDGQDDAEPDIQGDASGYGVFVEDYVGVLDVDATAAMPPVQPAAAAVSPAPKRDGKAGGRKVVAVAASCAALAVALGVFAVAASGALAPDGSSDGTSAATSAESEETDEAVEDEASVASPSDAAAAVAAAVLAGYDEEETEATASGEAVAETADETYTDEGDDGEDAILEPEVSTTADGAASQEEAATACEHVWAAVYEEVAHDAETSAVYHEAVYGLETTYHTVCNECLAVVDDAAEEHTAETGHVYFTENVPVEDEVVVQEAYYETVVVGEAWTETVLAGYVCELCGAESADGESVG